MDSGQTQGAGEAFVRIHWRSAPNYDTIAVTRAPLPLLWCDVRS
jgi:hypothetical protein